MTILVTGAAGFIGSNFVNHWFENTNENVISIDKLTYAGNLHNLDKQKNNANYFFIHADIQNKEALRKVFQKFEPRAIINFAAESHVDRSIDGPDDFINTNIFGTFSLLEEVRFYLEKTKNIKDSFRFLHISTDEVYGSLNSLDDPFKESNKYFPNSPYSASKASSDHLVRAWNKTFEIPTLITNCSNNYGPFQFPEKLIPLCIINAISGKELPIYGDGMQIRDWLYVKDHCEAIMCVLEKGKVGETYNIGGNCEMKNLDVVRLICEKLNHIKPLSNSRLYEDQIRFIKDRPGHDIRYSIDSSKIYNNLGWIPKENFDSGLNKTIDWYLMNPEWLKKIKTGEYRNLKINNL